MSSNDLDQYISRLENLLFRKEKLNKCLDQILEILSMLELKEISERNYPKVKSFSKVCAETDKTVMFSHDFIKDLRLKSPNCVDSTNNEKVDDKNKDVVGDNEKVDDEETPQSSLDNNEKVVEEETPPNSEDDNKEVVEEEKPSSVDNNEKVVEEEKPNSADDNEKVVEKNNILTVNSEDWNVLIERERHQKNVKE